MIGLSVFKNNVSLLLIIIIIGIGSLSIISYQSASFTADEIKKIAEEDIKSNARIQAYDLSRILVHSLDSINSNLKVLTSSPFLFESDIDQVQNLLYSAQSSTLNITDAYYWIDVNGRIVTSSKIYQTDKANEILDTQNQPFFLNPKKTLTPYYSTSITSKGSPSSNLYISYPLIKQQILKYQNNTYNAKQIFNGVLVAAISVKSLGLFLQNEMTSSIIGNVGLMDRDGVIIYARNQSLIGNNYMSKEFQSLIPNDLRESYNKIIEKGLEGKSLAEDLTYNGSAITLSYEPIVINGKFLWTLYVSFPHQLASNVGSLIAQQNNFSTLIVVITGSVTFGIIYLILSWNKRLEGEVNIRTGELKNTNISLMKSNELLEEANEQLKVHDKMQKEFINIAAHELRTPIMPILGEVEIIEEDLDPKTKTVKVEEEQIQLIIRNAKRLDRLASDILDVTKIESNSLKLEKSYFNLNDILSNSIRDIQNQVSSEDVGTKNIKIFYDPVDITIHGDKERINQVVSNLLSNALKFTCEGFIKIKIENANNSVIVSVEDSGSGIHPEIFPRLFCKFATKSDKGTGLGLYISKNVIDAHGGRIWAQNNRTGMGATFFFSLPLDKKK
ncbi:MAG TPA: sensor histidine kinase [Nitrososphaeraceae archaeon]|nr:sensor histidine kinase [Nitrososphaeraceae archaeon]